jgi:2-methylcitrate dehydratase PrpD
MEINFPADISFEENDLIFDKCVKQPEYRKAEKKSGKYSKNTEERTGNKKYPVESFLPTVINAGLAFKKDFQGVSQTIPFGGISDCIEIQNAGKYTQI